MEELAVRAWFDEYLDALTVRGRGEFDDLQRLLDYYAVPLVAATNDVVTRLTSEEQVVSFAGQQVDGMRSARVHRIVTVQSEVIALNSRAALYRAEFVRERADGSEVARLAVTYFITRGDEGLRIAAVALRAA